MNRHTVLAGVALIALAITLASCSTGAHTGAATQQTRQNGYQGRFQGNGTRGGFPPNGTHPPFPPNGTRAPPRGGSPFQPGTSFANSFLASHAYLISTQTLAQNATQALSGFQRTITPLANGSERVTLTAQRAGYQNQTYLVTPSEKLYFVEMSLGDDTGDHDYRTTDDHAVLVDANGTIVR